MPSEGHSKDDDEPRKEAITTSPSRSLFTIPPPLKRLFDRFPLQTYPANELPARSPQSRTRHVLYVFATSRNDVPSFNPSCLKWQTYLKLCGIDFDITSSSNHASPSGALPFLLPASTSKVEPSTPPYDPVPASKLQRWAIQQGKGASLEEPDDPRYEAYMSLVEQGIRRAWLYALYLTPNFNSIALPLYAHAASTSRLVRESIALSLRSAATAELAKFSAVINARDIYADTAAACEALEVLLGSNEWFFAAPQPGLFDAAVFAYTHLMLDDRLGQGWKDTELMETVRGNEGLVRHRDRLLKRCWPDL